MLNSIDKSTKNLLLMVFSSFLNEVDDQNFMFDYHVTFSYLLAFNLYTEAVTKNHSLRMLAARTEIAPLFYWFRHPKYQQLYLRDLFQRIQMPPELQQYQQENKSFRTSGVSNHGQGADFILRECLHKKFEEEFAQKKLI